MNWNKFKTVIIPVALGFIVVALGLSVLKSRFGIEIGDPASEDNQDESSAS